MILNKLVTFIYTIVGVRRSVSDEGKRTKEAAPPPPAAAGYVVVMEGTAMGSNSSSSSYLQGSTEGETCCVCLSSMEEGEETRVLPCFHEFHRVCVDKWVNTCKKNCPICRFSMGEEDRFMFHRREAFTEEMMIWFSSFHIAGF
ncbi:E3 ubiquitin-protein ligase At4g11680 [Gossypium raimondii]|uniref:RING-type E3 ubiquitin transferase n=1 Tax=Gossypium raimondii TaxID=29730 RepID=A0A0D2MHL6_GOSRA|nr:E3 ubiquitin-protein ligase At4g11680 [Gossypium raimondii]KJB17602.1 hypothetical protein B456_003G007100 [Gossypium raimondii]